MPGAATRPPGDGEAARLRGGAWPRSGRGIDRRRVCRLAGSTIDDKRFEESNIFFCSTQFFQVISHFLIVENENTFKKMEPPICLSKKLWCAL